MTHSFSNCISKAEDIKMKKVLILVAALCFSLVIGQPVMAGINDGLVGYWPFEGGSTEDASKGGHDGTENGGPTLVTGKVGDALHFMGGQRVTVGTWDPAETSGQMSLSVWVNWDGLTGSEMGVFAKRDGWGEGLVHWYLEGNPDNGSHNFGGFGSYPWFGDNIPPIGEWRHIVVTFDGTTAEMYIDGASVGAQGFAFTGAPDAMIVIGCVDGDGGNPYNGAIDEPALWDRVLTVDEVAQIYNEGAGMVLGGNQWKATLVAPSDGQKGMPSDEDTILQWGPPTEDPPQPITRYDLYFSDKLGRVADVNDLIAPTHSVLAGDPLEYNAGQLEPAVYYWRVDAVISDHEPNIAYGKVWSFDTIPAAPDVVSQPVGVMAAEGSTVQYTFVAASLHPITYEWKKEGDATFSEPGNVLTLENVTAADEGFYYCEATNIGGTTASASAGFELPKLLAHYKLDDVVAAIDELAPIADSGPFEHDGIEYGEVQSTGGFFDGALLFDGEGDYVDTGRWNPNITSPELTVSVWAKWGGPTGNYQALIGKRDDWGSSGALMMWQIGMDNGDGYLRFQRDGSGVDYVDQILPVDDWAQVAVTFDGTTARTYYNGTEVGSGAFSFGTGTDSLLLIGNAGINQDRFNGALDDVQIYNYAKTGDEVAQMYLDGSKEDSVCKKYHQYDYNRNCYVDLPDLAIFLDAWMDCNIVPDCIP